LVAKTAETDRRKKKKGGGNGGDWRARECCVKWGQKNGGSLALGCLLRSVALSPGPWRDLDVVDSQTLVVEFDGSCSVASARSSPVVNEEEIAHRLLFFNIV
jgi:hypothetical protein